MRSAIAWVSLLIISLAIAGGAASCGGDSSNTSSGQGAAAAGTGVGGEGGDLFTDTGGGVTAGLTIEPPEATIVVDNGASTPVQLKAMKGEQEVYPNSWSVDFGTIAGVDSTGLVTATNTKGGEVTVRAELDGVWGEAKVFVNYKKTVNDDAIPQDVQDKLKNATDPDADITWAYPYDGTVWPRGLKGPELMWNGGGAGDAYYLHFTGQYVDLEIFTYADPPSRHQLVLENWIAINESGSGNSGAIDVHVARLPAGAPAANVVIDHDWEMSRGNLRGTVYYWANNLGRIVRIKPGQDLPEDFLANAGVTECTACHTVSADGKTLLIGGDASTSVYDLLNDQTVLSTTSVGKPVRNWAMPAVSPDGKYLVENNAPLPGPPGGSDGLWETATGMKLAGTGLDGVLLDMPAFGPKGHKLVYVGHDAPHDLRVYDFDLATGMASNPQLLVGAGADPNLDAIAFPSVSPSITKGEGQAKTYTVYHRGVYPGSLDTRFGPGDLYMASVDEPGIEWRLEQANGDNYPFAAGDRDRHVQYEPTFAPEAAGGYLWVVFTSRRTYGNRLTGGSSQVKQLWVAAINPFPTAGEDPSYPAFWVPGQDPGTLNMRGYWALDPCIQQGDACVTSSDCCDGAACENGLCGGQEECADIGEFCDSAADCCDPNALCIAQECVYEAPQ